MNDQGVGTDPKFDPLFAGDGEMAALMRAKDWSATPLGTPDTWPRSLRTVVRILLTSRYAMWMGWGPDLLFFYNDAYRPTLGTKHPHALARPARQVWAEVWSAVGPRAESVRRGVATWDEGLQLFLERSGYVEETYHTFSYSPLSDDRDQVAGLLCVVTEETERIINERQLALLRVLATQLSASTSLEGVREAVAQALQSEPRDVPFSLMYLFEERGRRARLLCTTGLADGHPCAPDVVNVDEPSPSWPLRRVFEQNESEVVETLATGCEWPAGPWSIPPAEAAVFPIGPRGQGPPAGVFIAGLNPFRMLDGAYRSFLGLLVGQISAGLATAQAYEEERRRAEALAELDRAKTTFFSNVSHEFRTPLTLMLGPLDDLRGEAGPPEFRDQIDLVYRNGTRLLKLVNTLLDFSSIEAGRTQAAYEPTDLATTTADLASTFRSAMEKAGLEFVVDAPPLGAAVYVDRDMWEKIVLNLISNAFKFTFEGRVTITVRQEDGSAVLRVADTGTGVPADELPRLFDRFHRVANSKGRTHEGTGIGLALVAELVRLHGGTVDVESELGAGTTFTVRVPLGADHLPAQDVQRAGAPRPRHVRADAYIGEAVRAIAPDRTPDASADAGVDRDRRRAQRIVLADDNADMREYIQRLLQGRWDVEVVATGADALAAIQSSRPDLLITDVMMPGMDGFELLSRIRGDAALRDLPVILLTARAGEESRIEGLEAGADEYLVKPFSARELMARIETQLLRVRLRAAEDALRRRLAAVFEHAPAGIAVLRGPEHVYELANPPYGELVASRDLIGKPIREALPELEGQGVYELLDYVFATGQPFIGRSHRTLIQRSGPEPEVCFFDFVYQPMLGDDGQVEGIVVVAFDVTELAQARQSAELANRTKDEFLAMLGHELRNPLAPILTALQLMRLRPHGADRERGVIERQVKHLVGLVDDLLDVSRITRGKIELRKSRLEVAEAVAKAIEMASPLLEQQHHDLRLNVPRFGLEVEGDAGRLAQVISNLLTNAAKYTEPGGRITLTAGADAGQVMVSVRDTGIGIAAEMVPHVFDLFVQERQALDRSAGGLGIGLAIVRSLVHLHGGRVSARSEGQGKGSEFTIWLPLAAAPHMTVDGDTGKAENLTMPVHPDAPRVLVVDDNADAALMMGELLSASGYRTACAEDAPAALRTALEFDPDVAIFDIGLPVMDGYELARRFAEHPQLRRTRLVAVTGYGQESDRERSRAAGFVAHLVKPVDFEQLQAVLESLVRPAAE